MPCPYPRVQRRVFYKETHNSRNIRRLKVIRVSCKNHCLCNMSWNTPSSGGFQAMAPSGAQPCMSHEQLLSNRDALERKLSQRRPRQELVSIGIMPAVSAAPAILSQRTKLERAKTGDILQKKIRARPNRAQLIQKHILYETPVDPSLVDKQMRLKRKKLEDNLNDKLSFRPGPLELVKQNILEAGTEMSHAVQEGTVPFTETTSNYREPISPESVDSPEPSPDSSNIASPPSVSSSHSFASSPGSTCITSTVQALASLQAQTRKHSLEQQEQQQQQHQMFLQQQNGQQQVLPSQLPVSSTGTKKEARSRKKTAKPKVKKYKYHEYRPPNGEVQKSELPSDSPYGLLLQQQQLYLQLQVLFQNYPHHCMLPSIPENAKVSSNGGKNNNSNAEKPVKIEEMRVVDMRRALKERGLPVFGSKTDLIKRLQEIGAFPPPEPNASTTISPPVVSTQAQVTTSAPISSSVPALPTNSVHPPLHRSNSLPLQTPNLNTVQQLQMQILANNQSLQQLKVPPEVQQQLQQLQYLNLQLQLQHLNIQQQQNIQPKPMDTPVTCQTASVKTETLTNNTCTFQGSPVNQSQTSEQKPVPFAVKRECQTVQMSPRNPHQQQLAKTQTQVKQQQVDQVNQALVHLHEQAQSLDSIDSNASSVESQVLSWDQQHPLFDGESESYPSPGSQLSDMSNLSPLPADNLSHSMDSLHSSSVFHGNAKPDNHLIPGSYPERSSDEYLSMVPQRKPRSLSEPQFPVSTHRRTSSFPSIPFATPPPSYEAAVAAQSQKQFQNVSFGSQMVGGFPIMNSVSPKQDDMDFHLDSVIQDKELSQELQKAMMKNFASLNHDDILEILGEPCSQFPTTAVTNSFAGIMTPSLTTSGNQPPMSKSPSYGSYLSQRFVPPSQNSPGRMSRSCDDVSQLSVNNKFPFQAENGAMCDFDNFLTSPLSPMKIDSCDTDDSPGLLFNSSNSIPIPSSNGIVGKTDTLSWLDLSMSPTAQQSIPHANVELTSIHNNNHKGTPPLNLYDDHEHTPLSLFDLETPTALHPPSDFGEAMDYCI